MDTHSELAALQEFAINRESGGLEFQVEWCVRFFRGRALPRAKATSGQAMRAARASSKARSRPRNSAATREGTELPEHDDCRGYDLSHVIHSINHDVDEIDQLHATRDEAGPIHPKVIDDAD